MKLSPHQNKQQLIEQEIKEKNPEIYEVLSAHAAYISELRELIEEIQTLHLKTADQVLDLYDRLVKMHKIRPVTHSKVH